jgi:hypothetical protein
MRTAADSNRTPLRAPEVSAHCATGAAFTVRGNDRDAAFSLPEKYPHPSPPVTAKVDKASCVGFWGLAEDQRCYLLALMVRSRAMNQTDPSARSCAESVRRPNWMVFVIGLLPLLPIQCHRLNTDIKRKNRIILICIYETHKLSAD